MRALNVSPGYREIPPPAALRDVVACLWVRVSGTGGDVRVLPDGCTDVVWEQGAGTTVAGPDTGPKLVGRAAGDVAIGMRFLPGAAGGALGVPLDAVRDLRVEAAEVDRSLDLPGHLAPADVVRRFVAAAEGRRGDPLVTAAAARLQDAEVAAVARELGVSERQLRRRFHRAAGYGPKTLARVLRFRRFVAAVDAGATDLGRLALDAGYADQAHLSRETTRLAGLPPLRLVDSRRAP